MLQILERIVAGQGEAEDLDMLLELADTISATALCGWVKRRRCLWSARSNTSGLNMKRMCWKNAAGEKLPETEVDRYRP